MATEQQPYEVIRTEPTFELRRYPEHVVAEVTISAAFEDAGNRAFRSLFGYISGENRSRTKVAMTAPVVQSEAEGAAEGAAESVEIAMTAPVVQQAAGPGDGTGSGTGTGDGTEEYRVAFVLPADFTADTAPEPTNPAVRVLAMPATTAAAVRFSGRWTESGYQTHLADLRRDLEAAGLVARGAPRFARFDAPYVPAFLRRNEVVLDVDTTPDAEPFA